MEWQHTTPKETGGSSSVGTTGPFACKRRAILDQRQQGQFRYSLGAELSKPPDKGHTDLPSDKSRPHLLLLQYCSLKKVFKIELRILLGQNSLFLEPKGAVSFVSRVRFWIRVRTEARSSTRAHPTWDPSHNLILEESDLQRACQLAPASSCRQVWVTH